MEDAADAVVPLRPGFDIQVRGFNRNQVIDHLELLEDQLKMASIDRNEAVRLNTDLRKWCEDTRQNLVETEDKLRSIESSDTGLPAASQRVQNMLDLGEEEVQTIRDEAKRHAEVIRGAAENEARELITQAERTTSELRSECADLAADIEAQRKRLDREHSQSLSDLRNREYRMRQSIRDEYKETIAVAQNEADELLTRARQECREQDAETERWRLETVEELHVERVQLEELRQKVLTALDSAGDLIGTSTSTIRSQVPPPIIDTPESSADTNLRLPEQRDDGETFTIPLDQHTNGSTPENGASDAVRWN